MDKPTPEELARRAKQGHRPGRRILARDETVYEVQASGAWKRTTPKRFEGRKGLRRQRRVG